MDRREAERHHREIQLKRRKKRRRKQRLIRGLLLFLIVLVLGLVLALGIFCGKRLVGYFTERKADIVLDAGHGGKDQGASSGNVLEKDITLDIAQLTKELLKDAGYRVALVRSKDTFVELGERAKYANQKNAKVYVSIHCNSSESGEGNGIETFYRESDAEGQTLAALLQAALVGETGAEDRGVKTADYQVLRETDMAAALVETGFLSDASECGHLQEAEYRQKLAKAICDGLIDYMNQQMK